MRLARRARLALPVLACALAACGTGTGAAAPTPTASRASIPLARVAAARLLNWPEFGLNPQRSDVSELSTGIKSANVGKLRRLTVTVPGTVDSSPVYVHAASVAGGSHNIVVVTTTYGRTLAIDADSGRTLWQFNPPGLRGWLGSAQITTASPILDPSGRFIYAASPNGAIHKLSVADGAEVQAGSWPVAITRDPTREKLAAALNIDGRWLIAATGGYFGDAPPYQGHVVLIDRSTGRIGAVFNTLCAGRRQIITPSSCPSSDSAILSRAGAVVEPGGGRILISTGNGPWDGSRDFGDSVLELTVPSLSLRQSFTPVNQSELNAGDTDLGSSAPALLGSGRVLIAGKDGVMRVLDLARLDGAAPGQGHRLGGEVQRLAVPAGAQLFSAPAVWRHDGRTTVFIADEGATAAYVMRGGILYRAWQNSRSGTSPVMAGGLLYVYDQSAGVLDVYRPSSPDPTATLHVRSGHWNSPVVADSHLVVPEGNGNDHSSSGTLDIFSAR